MRRALEYPPFPSTLLSLLSLSNYIIQFDYHLNLAPPLVFLISSPCTVRPPRLLLSDRPTARHSPPLLRDHQWPPDLLLLLWPEEGLDDRKSLGTTGQHRRGSRESVLQSKRVGKREKGSGGRTKRIDVPGPRLEEVWKGGRSARDGRRDLWERSKRGTGKDDGRKGGWKRTR